MTLMAAARICLIAALITGLTGCKRNIETSVPADAPPSRDSKATASVSGQAAGDAAPTKAQPTTQATSVGQPTAKSPAAKSPSVQPPAAKQPTVNSPVAKSKVAAPAPPAAKPVTAAAAPTLDLAGLEKQLRSTKAIGVFSKIALKNQVDDLLGKFRDHYKGKEPPTMMQLRSSYDLLIMKVLSMVQDHDPPLATAIVSSRAAIWALLADPNKFATLDL